MTIFSTCIHYICFYFSELVHFHDNFVQECRDDGSPELRLLNLDDFLQSKSKVILIFRFLRMA